MVQSLVLTINWLIRSWWCTRAIHFWQQQHVPQHSTQWNFIITMTMQFLYYKQLLKHSYPLSRENAHHNQKIFDVAFMGLKNNKYPYHLSPNCFLLVKLCSSLILYVNWLLIWLYHNTELFFICPNEFLWRTICKYTNPNILSYFTISI